MVAEPNVRDPWIVPGASVLILERTGPRSSDSIRRLTHTQVVLVSGRKFRRGDLMEVGSTYGFRARLMREPRAVAPATRRPKAVPASVSEEVRRFVAAADALHRTYSSTATCEPRVGLRAVTEHCAWTCRKDAHDAERREYADARAALGTVAGDQ